MSVGLFCSVAEKEVTLEFHVKQGMDIATRSKGKKTYRLMLRFRKPGCTRAQTCEFSEI